jgi:hypothetical protein
MEKFSYSMKRFSPVKLCFEKIDLPYGISLGGIFSSLIQFMNSIKSKIEGNSIKFHIFFYNL